ncbi:MAG: UDP-N-acetylmuramate dehydrogenase [Erysipelotrichaceae bacterium]|nr:UDP-N-acetylmuramate dehydrogenase [Erysipelotrichaceae bacterium]
MNLAERLQQYAIVEQNVPFSNMTTFRIGGVVDYVIYPNDVLALQEVLDVIRKEGMPVKLIGKGSNILCSDQPFHGAVIRLDRTLANHYYQDNEVLAQAGCSIIALSYDAMKRGLSGLEFASGIPATVGGCTYMNAGAYKSCMADIIKEVYVYRDGQLCWMKPEECAFAYRTSVFQEHKDWVIVAVRIGLQPKDSEEIRTLMENRKERRMASQPLEYPSAGSVFRNPENAFAWKYIDELGLRGKTVGGAQISSKHSNFIVNVNHAKADDVLALMEEIDQKMEERHGFRMIKEVELFNW